MSHQGLSELKNHKTITSVFELKSPSDYESSWSPTSPLDFNLFSNLGNPFAGSSSKSIRKQHQKSWDSGKVGLSIVDDHHTDSSRILLPSPNSKNIIFGSLMRSENPQLPNHAVQDLIELDSSCLGSESAITSKPPIEISEDYTCVISHGLNPKTTHFYRDQVLETVEQKKCCFGNKKESIFLIAPLDLSTPIDVLPSNDFLSFCCNCSKKLGTEKDIYMYRGYKAFCSSECRSEEIPLDEKMEEEEEALCDSSSEKDMFEKKKSNIVVFTVG